MARVLREAVAVAPCATAAINRVITDLNGERCRFVEWAMTNNPALASLPPDWRVWCPADCIGDVGAATGAVHITMAVRALHRGYARGEAILIANSSESGERAAVFVYNSNDRDSR